MEVELPDGMEEDLQRLVDAGSYISVEEAVRDAVRRYLARNSEIVQELRDLED